MYAEHATITILFLNHLFIMLISFSIFINLDMARTFSNKKK